MSIWVPGEGNVLFCPHIACKNVIRVWWASLLSFNMFNHSVMYCASAGEIYECSGLHCIFFSFVSVPTCSCFLDSKIIPLVKRLYRQPHCTSAGVSGAWTLVSLIVVYISSFFHMNYRNILCLSLIKRFHFIPKCAMSSLLLKLKFNQKKISFNMMAPIEQCLLVFLCCK